MSFSTVFHSYQEDERLIMDGCVQWYPVYRCEDFASSVTRDSNLEQLDQQASV